MFKKSLAAVACLALFGCTTGPDGERSVSKTAVGGVLGAVAGGALGNQLDDDGNRDRGTSAPPPARRPAPASAT